MGKQDVYIKIKKLKQKSLGEEGQCLRNYFNVPNEDEDEDYNEIIEANGSYEYPICNIDDAIKLLQDRKEKGANFVHIYDHQDHGEIVFETFEIEKLSDEEVAEYKANLEKEEIEKFKRVEERERKKYEELKNKFG
jgi:mannose/fructose/N-acetylgalactosamine-specific phosphotransferase system component IIB